MALEDRDWYREEPSKAWKKRWDALPGVHRGGGSGTPSSGKGVQPQHGALFAVLISAGLIFITWHWHLLRHVGHASANPPGPAFARPSSNSQVPTPQASNVVRLRPSANLDTPATRVTRWTLRDPRFGTFSVYVPIGETPRQALTVALAERGFQVIP